MSKSDNAEAEREALTLHIRIGDLSVGQSGSFSAAVCTCACTRCLAGSCCQSGTGVTWPDSVAWPDTNPPAVCPPHDFVQAANELYGTRIFCRKCGESKYLS